MLDGFPFYPHSRKPSEVYSQITSDQFAIYKSAIFYLHFVVVVVTIYLGTLKDRKPLLFLLLSIVFPFPLFFFPLSLSIYLYKGYE